ncbi:MAG: type II secretion system F family protein [Armatimonadetes bacterium]|nr:type II secretion system F family protein [Armatimonadota bacterium]
MPPVAIIAAATLLTGVAIAALIMAFSSARRQESGDEPVAVEPAPQPHVRPGDASPIITGTLQRMGVNRRLQWMLLQAGLLLRPSELVALMLGCAGAGFVIGMVVRQLLGAIVLALVGLMIPWFYVSIRISARRRSLGNQLAEALSMMASSLRSGYSFLRAMQVVCDEMDPPISEEFGRLLDELNVGVSQEDALKHLHERCPTPDVELVVTACQIQANVGGNLAEILETAAEMIRERVRLHGEINALTAEGRLSAGILAALPVFLALVVDRLSPGYLQPLFSTKPGLIMFGGASVAMLAGLALIKKMLNIQI